MSYNDELLKVQTKNLFDIPLDVETQFDNTNTNTNTNINSGLDLSQVEIGGGISPFKLEQQQQQYQQTGGKSNRNLNLEIQDDFTTDFEEVKINDGKIEIIQNGGDPQLFDKIELNRSSSSEQLNKQDFTEEIIPMSSPTPPTTSMQSGGNNGFEENETDMDMDLNDIEEYGNRDNIGEDALNADDDMFDEQGNVNINEKERINEEPPNWVHPELSIEDDNEMIVKLNQDDIDSKVAMYLDYYNSDEYQEYLKYFQIIYSASSQKYSVRRDIEGNIYLVKRATQAKELKGKKTRESIEEIMNDKEYKKNYMIKLIPPEYLDIKDELKKITNELNVLSGHIKIIQKDLIELGIDIKKDDIKAFEKIRNKFYKLINKKYIYTKYYQDVNNLFEESEKTDIYANELISFEDTNDITSYKLKSYIVGASNLLVENITTQLKENLEKYSEIINTSKLDKDQDKVKDQDKDKKEYNKLIKDFLVNKKINEDKNQKELNSLINFSKTKINFIIKKLPKIDVKSEPN
jgi:hypothetical protein